MAGRRGVFVTGTDTGVGKTVVAACLVHRWRAEYWKPIQTGLADEEGDSPTVARLAHPLHIHPPLYALAAPLSPEAAAARAAVSIDFDAFRLPAGDAPLVVEGAGGVLVPLGGGRSMADLIGRLGLPVVLVARSTLGTINHTLLSLEALAARDCRVMGVVLVGPDAAENAAAIARLGHARILGCLPRLPVVDAAAIAKAAEALPKDPPLPTLEGDWGNARL